MNTEGQVGPVESNIALSDNVIDKARERLKNSICSIRNRITRSEHTFLHWLLTNGLESDLEFAIELLRDQDLFPQPPPSNSTPMLHDESLLDDDSPQKFTYNRQSSSYMSDASSLDFSIIPESLSQEKFMKPVFVTDGTGAEQPNFNSNNDNSMNTNHGLHRSVSEDVRNLPDDNRGSLSVVQLSARGGAKLQRTKSMPSMHIIDFAKREKHLNRRRKSSRLSRVGLWKAHQDGVAPSELKRRSLIGLNQSELLPIVKKNKEKRKGRHHRQRSLSDSEAIANMANALRSDDIPLGELVQGDATTFLQEDPLTSVELLKDIAGHDTQDKLKTFAPGLKNETKELAPFDVAQDEFSYNVIKRQVSSGGQGIELEISLEKELEIARTNSKSAQPLSGINEVDSWSQNSVKDTDDESSFSSDEDELTIHDAWNVLKDEYCLACGYGGDTLPFQILGTSADDTNAHPHVLSPPLMESLQAFLPNTVSQQNFWLKYSLLRDGASYYKLLQNIRGACNTIIAVETTRGRVFGSYTTKPWRKNWRYFGNGESFLWRMKQSRLTPCSSILDQAVLESELEVYPATGENDYYQLCLHNMIAVGGGGMDPFENEACSDRDNNLTLLSDDFGLCIDDDLLTGSTSPCITFNNPCLSTRKVDVESDLFQIANLEVWTLTPCHTLNDAEKLELGLMFLRKHGD